MENKKGKKKNRIIAILLLGVLILVSFSAFLYSNSLLPERLMLGIHRFFDNTPPTITVNRQSFELGEDYSVKEFISITDDVDTELDVDLVVPDDAFVMSKQIFSFVDTGTYDITITAKDYKGNESTKSVKIMVSDTTPPKFQQDFSSQTEYGNTIKLSTSKTENAILSNADDYSTITYAIESVEPVTEGLDDTSYRIIDAETIEFNKSGIFTVKVIATDYFGNSSYGNTTVTVKDTKQPTITKTKDSISVVEGDVSSIDFSNYITANDEMDGSISVVADTSNVNYDLPGEYTVPITATDTSGNTSYDSVVVVVKEKPVVKPSYSSSQTYSESNGGTVYITRTGSKYHNSGCPSLSKSKIAISYSEAISQGYTACKRCH